MVDKTKFKYWILEFSSGSANGTEPTFHGPVIDSSVCDQSNCVEVHPAPEDNVFSHIMCFHLALHLNVEDLKGLASCEKQIDRTRILEPSIHCYMYMYYWVNSM
jgi:hypothetical protein